MVSKITLTAVTVDVTIDRRRVQSAVDLFVYELKTITLGNVVCLSLISEVLFVFILFKSMFNHILNQALEICHL